MAYVTSKFFTNGKKARISKELWKVITFNASLLIIQLGMITYWLKSFKGW